MEGDISSQSYPFSSELYPDSGYYGNPAFDPGLLPGPIVQLEEWQDTALRGWYAKHRRNPNNDEVFHFCGLFQMDEAIIRYQIARITQDSMPYHIPDSYSLSPAAGLALRTYNPVVPNAPYGGNYLPGPEPQLNHWPVMNTVPSIALPFDGTIPEPSIEYRDHIDLDDQQHTGPRCTAPSMEFQKALKTLIKTEAIANRRKGCGPIRCHEKQFGTFPCTLGCGRRFKSACELFRHEEIVYPQQFYYCFRCGGNSTPSERYLFFRKDKMQQHIRKNHKSHLDSITVEQCKLTNCYVSFPKKCSVCLHHRHRDWRERCKHVTFHCKNGHYPAQYLQRNSATASNDLAVGCSDDEDDDDGSDDDNDDDEGQDNNDNDDDDDDDEGAQDDENLKDGSARDDNDENNTSDNPPSNGQYFGHDQQDSSDRRDTNRGYTSPSGSLALAFFDLGSYKSLGASHQVRLTPLQLFAENKSSPRPPLVVPLTTLERVNRKGGTAAVFKVEIPMDLETGNSSGLMTYAVKQYPAAHQHSFKREVNALSILHTQKTAATNIVRCYGTFEHFTFGETTYNLVLEYGESDLSDYWARNPTPHDSVVLEQFWVSLLGIVEAVSRIHDAELSDSIVYHGVHADIKPDNILCFNGTLKLADFGFTNFTYAHNQSSWEALRVIGGTAAYGAPELTSHAYAHESLRLTQKADVWSIGCVLSEAVTWSVLGAGGLQSFRKKGHSKNRPSRFHDGKSVLPPVLEWHKYLGSKTKHDYLPYGSVLDIVNNHILREDPAQRWTTREILVSLRWTFTRYKDRWRQSCGLSQTNRDTSLDLLDTRYTDLCEWDTRAFEPLNLEPIHVAGFPGHRYCKVPIMAFVPCKSSIGSIRTNLRNGVNHTPLMSAVWSIDRDVVQLLLSTGEVQDSLKGKKEEAPMAQTTWFRYNDTLGSLHGMSKASTKADYSREQTSLMGAVWFRFGNTVELWLSTDRLCGIEEDIAEQTTMMQISRFPYRETAELLDDPVKAYKDGRKEEGYMLQRWAALEEQGDTEMNLLCGYHELVAWKQMSSCMGLSELIEMRERNKDRHRSNEHLRERGATKIHSRYSTATDMLIPSHRIADEEAFQRPEQETASMRLGSCLKSKCIAYPLQRTNKDDSILLGWTMC